MKNFLMVAALILMNGCASDPNNGMIPRVYSYVSGATQKELSKASPAAFQNIIETGFRKLSIDELYQLNQFKLKIISTSRENCLVMLEDGGISSPKKELALKTLPPSDYDQYAKIIAKAITLGPDDSVKPAPKFNKTEFEKAMNVALETQTVGELPKHLALVKDPAQDQCWMFYKGLTYADQKRNRFSEVIVRYMGI
jgi:hypothetical protein